MIESSLKDEKLHGVTRNFHGCLCIYSLSRNLCMGRARLRKLLAPSACGKTIGAFGVSKSEVGHFSISAVPSLPNIAGK